jgi:hypothetical protein
LTNRITVSLVLLCLTVAPAASAAPVTVPEGLHPGDHYRLVLVTSGGTDALSSDISAYDDFVSTTAASSPTLAALGTTWFAIASTARSAACFHTGTSPLQAAGVPIYNLGGGLVAANNADLWDGAIIRAIFVDELGTIQNTRVWTGTTPDGFANGLGLGQPLGTFGQSTSTDASWIDAPIFENAVDAHSLYGISNTLTVLPEPGAMPLTCLTAALILSTTARRRLFNPFTARAPMPDRRPRGT